MMVAIKNGAFWREVEAISMKRRRRSRLTLIRMIMRRAREGGKRRRLAMMGSSGRGGGVGRSKAVRMSGRLRRMRDQMAKGMARRLAGKAKKERMQAMT